jgi:predicted metal-dependent phosphoesterase TrpH
VRLESEAAVAGNASLGRRHVAQLLIRARKARSIREAFARYLGDGGRATVPKARLPAAEAIALVRGAGGVAALAHPPYDCSGAVVTELGHAGLQALEVEYPGFRAAWTRQLRTWAADLGLGVTGGSDCHGPGRQRPLGARTVTAAELYALREMAGR